MDLEEFEKLYNNKAISFPFSYTIVLPVYGSGTAGKRFLLLAGDFSSSVYEGQKWGVSNMVSHLLDSRSRVGNWGPQQQAGRKERGQEDHNGGLIWIGKAIRECEL